MKEHAFHLVPSSQLFVRKMTPSQRLLELAELVVDASSSWTGEDEEKTPALKKARTLAGLAIREA